MRKLLFAVVSVVGVVPMLSASEFLVVQGEPSYGGRTVTQWLAYLEGSEGLRQREIALLALGTHGTDENVWTSLTNRRRAGLLGAVLIGPVKAPQIVPAISRAMQRDPSPLIRKEAARALGRIGKNAAANSIRFDLARNALIEALRIDSSSRVREAAASALGQLDPRLAGKAVPALITLLSDSDAGVRNAAADTLRRLKEYAEPALPALFELVKDPKAQTLTRMQAALAIGQIGGEKALPGIEALHAVIADATTPEDVRVAAVESLGLFEAEAAKTAPTLAKILTDSKESVRVRRAISAALDQFGSAARPVLPQLLLAFKDKDRFVRGFAMHTVSQMGAELGPDTSKVVQAYFEGIDDTVLEVRVTAIESLGALGKEGLGSELPKVVAKLADLKNDSQKDIRAAALNAASKLE